jgi:ubiquinone/menaquinone biosynthesis C-methylase UbiE
MQEKYSPGYSSNAMNFMAKRSLDTHAAFFKPYLRPGMNLLDCGCGPGANTARLRKIVGWVEALRNPTKPPKCWVSFLNPTYTG